MIVSVEESDILNDLVVQMTAMVAREEQREKDRAGERELRRSLRRQDDDWKKETVRRIDRVQADLGTLQQSVMGLMKAVDNRVTETANRVAAEVRRDAEETARNLHKETAETAAELKEATAALALIRKQNEDKRLESKVKTRLLGTTTRTFIVLIIVALLMALAFALFEHRDDISGDIATGLASTIAVAALIYNFYRRG